MKQKFKIGQHVLCVDGRRSHGLIRKGRTYIVSGLAEVISGDHGILLEGVEMPETYYKGFHCWRFKSTRKRVSHTE